ncbi:MAG TPA: hypothetical protein VF556_04775 [Pyrinomonadaceae bacterium]
MCKSFHGFPITKYSKIRSKAVGLRLVASNGKVLENVAGFELFKILGVVTHVVKTLTKPEADN